MTLHLQGLLPGKVPDTWLKEHWYFACTECQSLVADYHPDPPPPSVSAPVCVPVVTVGEVTEYVTVFDHRW